MKILLEIPDDKATTLLNFLKSISYIKVKPLTYNKAQLIDEISEAFQNMNYDSSFGKIKDYNVGDIVVWRGNDPAIGRILKKREEKENIGCFSFIEKDDYNCLSFENLRYATEGETMLLGEANFLLL